MEHENDGDTNCNWCPLYSHQIFDSGTEGLGNKRTIGDHPSIAEISQNTEKSPRDLRKLAITSGKPSANADMKKSQKRKNNVILNCKLDIFNFKKDKNY